MNKDEWEDLKNGVVSFEEGTHPNYKDLYSIQEGDTWGFPTDELSSKYTGLPAYLLLEPKDVPSAIKDYLPKVRIKNSDNSYFHLCI